MPQREDEQDVLYEEVEALQQARADIQDLSELAETLRNRSDSFETPGEAERAVLERVDKAVANFASLADAYKRSIRHQRQLIRYSDRVQEDLRKAKTALANETERLEALNSQLEHEVARRRELEEELRERARTDSLTGLSTRRHFFEFAEHERQRMARKDTALAVLICDIDHFKSFNDSYGHACGDAVLVRVAEILNEQLREGDIVGRLGGEEFAALLPDADLSNAARVAERLRRTAATEPCDVGGGQCVNLTLSCGVAEIGATATTVEAALDRADQALYQAKEQGRNRVVTAEPPVPLEALDGL